MKSNLVVLFASIICLLFPAITDASIIIKPSLMLGTAGLNNGLVGHWTFDGKDMTSNVADASGNGKNGKIYGMTSTTTAPGKLGQALSLDGVDDFVAVAGLEDEFDGATQITTSIWFKEEQNVGYLMAQRRSGFTQWYLHRNTCCGSQERVTFFVDTVSGSASAFASGLGDGEWHHAVGVYDGSYVYLYIDGVEAQKTARTGGIKSYDYNVCIGNSGHGDCVESNKFGGLLDDARLYNRALSASEVQKLYNKGQTKTGKTSQRTGDSLNVGLLNHWTFDGKDMTGATAVDRGSAGSDITISGEALSIGKLGQGVLYDGNDGTSVTKLGSLLTDIDVYTVSAWVKMNSNDIQVIWAENDGNGFGDNNGIFEFNFTSSGFRFVPGKDSADSILSAYPVGEWAHLVGVKNGTSAEFFINSESVGTDSSVAAGTNNNGSEHNIGKPDLDERYFNGTIDDPRIYDRVLTPDEIRRLYSKGVPKMAVTPKNSLTDGLIGHWTFDGKDMTSNVADSSTSGNNGWIVGQTSTTTAPGKLGQALEFDGVDDYVNFGDPDLVEGLSGLSVSAWVKSNVSDAGGLSIAEQSGGGNDPFHLYLHGSNWVLFNVKDSSNVSHEAGFGGIKIDVDDYDWHHVIGTWNGSVVEVYVDGVASGVTASHTDTTPTATANLNIGSDSAFVGSVIDDVRIYNRGLSPYEVQRLYNMGR